MQTWPILAWVSTVEFRYLMPYAIVAVAVKLVSAASNEIASVVCHSNSKCLSHLQFKPTALRLFRSGPLRQPADLSLSLPSMSVLATALAKTLRCSRQCEAELHIGEIQVQAVLLRSCNI